MIFATIFKIYFYKIMKTFYPFFYWRFFKINYFCCCIFIFILKNIREPEEIIQKNLNQIKFVKIWVIIKSKLSHQGRQLATHNH